MQGQFAFKVVAGKRLDKKSLIGIADLAIGYTAGDGRFVGLQVQKGYKLFLTNGKYWFKGPEAPVVRNGEIEKDDNGYDKYEEKVLLYAERGAKKGEPDKMAVTETAWKFRDKVVEKLVEFFDNEGTAAPRSAAPQADRPARTTRADAPVRTRPEAARTQIDEGTDDDAEDLPF